MLKTMPRNTTVGPACHTILSTGGNWRNADTRSFHGIQRLCFVRVIDFGLTRRVTLPLRIDHAIGSSTELCLDGWRVSLDAKENAGRF